MWFCIILYICICIKVFSQICVNPLLSFFSGSHDPVLVHFFCNCMLCFSHQQAPPHCPRHLDHKTKKSLELNPCKTTDPRLTKTPNPAVLGLGLRTPIPRCFSGSCRAAAASTHRCTTRRSRRWPAPSITARTRSTSSRARSSLTTTWTRRL